MNLQQIKDKYRSILEEDFPQNSNKYHTYGNQCNDEQLSERQWINIAKKQKQKRVLTEAATNKQNPTRYQKQSRKSNVLSKKSSVKLSTEETIIELKQKLAQSLLNCSRKDTELTQFENLIVKKNQQIKSSQKSIAQLKKVIEQKDSLILSEKLQQESLKKQINSRDFSIDELKVQNQLLRKHIQNYAKELECMNLKFHSEQLFYEKVEKQKEKVDGLKSKIQKLRDDVKRLQLLLSDNESYAPLLASMEGKHFLGKPSKQSKQLEYWFPQSLINGVEKFLKKEQVGYGNKTFSQNLVKFIYGLLQRSEKTGEKKIKSKYTSRIKQIQRKKNHILNNIEESFINQTKKISSVNSRLKASSLRKTTPVNGNSQMKSRDLSICLQKSLCFERQTVSTVKNNIKDSQVDRTKGFIIEGLQKSVRLNENHKRHVVIELVESFIKGVQKLFKLDNKILVQQKVTDLCVWLKQSIEEIYQSSKLMEEDQYNQTGKWKTLSNL